MKTIKQTKLKRAELLGMLCFLAFGAGAVFATSTNLATKLLISANMLLLTAVVCLLIEGRRRSHEYFCSTIASAQRLANDVQQITSSMVLHQQLKPTFILPPARGWAASPDFLELVSREIAMRQPAVILELGSGLSTAIVGYSLKAYSPESRVVSLDHSADYAEKTKELLRKHKLTQWSTVIHAPLVPNENGEHWYDIERLPSELVFDMVIVDGPPCVGNPFARKPTREMLVGRISHCCVFIFDDTKRAADAQVLEGYLSDSPGSSCESYDTEKGAAIISGLTKVDE